MFTYSIPLVTINGRFHSESKKIHRSRLWHSENLANIIPYESRRLNYITIKTQSFTFMIFSKGGYRLLVKSIIIIDDVKKIIDKIRKKIASKLFEERLTKATYGVTQIQVSIHPPFNSPLLTYEKLTRIFPKNFVVQDIEIRLEIDHFLHETGCSHFCLRLYSNENKVGFCNLYNNYKIVVFLHNISLLKNSFSAVSDLLQQIHTKCHHLLLLSI